jgi:hypothetical protein
MKKGLTSLVSFQQLEFAFRLATIVFRSSFLPCYSFLGVLLVVCSRSTTLKSQDQHLFTLRLFTVFTLQSYLSPCIPIGLFTLQPYHSLFAVLLTYLSALPFNFQPYYSTCSLLSHLPAFLVTVQVYSLTIHHASDNVYLSASPVIFLHCYLPCSHHISHLDAFLISLQPCYSPDSVHLASLLFT